MSMIFVLTQYGENLGFFNFFVFLHFSCFLGIFLLHLFSINWKFISAACFC